MWKVEAGGFGRGLGLCVLRRLKSKGEQTADDIGLIFLKKERSGRLDADECKNQREEKAERL